MTQVIRVGDERYGEEQGQEAEAAVDAALTITVQYIRRYACVMASTGYAWFGRYSATRYGALCSLITKYPADFAAYNITVEDQP